MAYFANITGNTGMVKVGNPSSLDPPEAKQALKEKARRYINFYDPALSDNYTQ